MIKEMSADIVIVGGGTGGCAAAMAACQMGKRVIMTEETLWIGGQLTSQAVPPDEHPWIEQFGSTQSYRQFRNRIRDFYRRNFPLKPEVGMNTTFNPGGGLVSALTHEPKVALAVLQEMLAPYVHSGRLTILIRHKAIQVSTDGDNISSITVQSLETDNQIELTAPYFLDASETGDVLPLAGVEYVTGAESKQQTGEPHAVDGEAQPMTMQAFTYCFAMDYLEGENHIIEKPTNYDFWKAYTPDFWPGPLLSWVGSHPITLKPRQYGLFPGHGEYSLWLFRQIVNKDHFIDGTYERDATLVNWPQNDYWLGSIIDVDEKERQHHLDQGKQLSLSLLYWMQTEAPRPDGKQGYPGLRLRHDIVGTEDGLAMHPYIRESRRIKAEFTVLEQHVSYDVRGEHGAESFDDSVGIGCYRIDLHPSTGNRNYIDISSLPFQIPLGSLIPQRVNNLIAASKNIGVTHITNGCYRLHPVEWNIGESAGYLAAYCLNHDLLPRNVRNNKKTLVDFQQMISQQGIELAWPKIHHV